MTTFHDENKSEERGKIRSQGGKAGPFKSTCSMAKESGDQGLCLLWCLEGVSDSRAFWEAGKAMKKTVI